MTAAIKNAFTGEPLMKKTTEKPLDVFAHWHQPRTARMFADPSTDPGVDCSNLPSLTDQSQAAECDVNTIMDRFLKTGVLPGVDAERLYGDFTSVPDFQEAQNIMRQATTQFASLDARLRRRFDNNPAEFLAFATDPKNGEELVKLGLATASPKPPSPASPDESSKASTASEKKAPPKKEPKGENDA